VRTSIMRLSILASLILAVAMTAAASASADTLSCKAAGSIKLSPGLTTTPAVQNVQIKGSLSECTGTETEVKEAKFQAHFKTAEAVSCATLKGPGVGAATEENKLIVKFKSAGNSMGTISVPITEVASVSVTGLINSGPFIEDAISGSVSQTYTGGTTCGEVVGKKKAKAVSKGALAGTLSIS